VSLNLSQFLAQVKNASTWQDMGRGIYEMLSQMQDHVNNGFQQLGVSTFQKSAPPDPPDNLNVVANNGTVHAVITHNAPITKTLHYFIEADTSPAFSQPHVFDLGASRTLFTSLPNKDGNGDIQTWNFRAYSQYHGSVASEKINYGSKFTPTAVTVGGTAQFTPIPSTGSGTASPLGTQGGQGLGTVFQRAPVGPKRTSGT
jgi:hypothetical protein